MASMRLLLAVTLLYADYNQSVKPSGGQVPAPPIQMPASIAIPVIVSGTIVIALLFAYTVLDEPSRVTLWPGCALILAGKSLMFWKK